MTGGELRASLRFLMRAAYSVTGFFIAMLAAGVAHDGLTPEGTLPAQFGLLTRTILSFWLFGLLLDATTRKSKP